MASNYDENYLDGLIAKAKESWEGVDVESYMKNLRDDSFDKEVAKEVAEEVSSCIINQIRNNYENDRRKSKRSCMANL